MVDITEPSNLDSSFGQVLRSRKSDFVSEGSDAAVVAQHGAARIGSAEWPGWPDNLDAEEPTIETFVAERDQVSPTSDNEPFVDAWTPLAQWMNCTVRTALGAVGVKLAGDGFITASLTPTALLQGVAHLDDDQFVPEGSVAMVAIIGELAGPRVATTPLEPAPLRPMGSVVFADALLQTFSANEIDHCAGAPNELVVFPQFGQLHAGPSAEHVAHLGPTRQLLVMRAQVSLS